MKTTSSRTGTVRFIARGETQKLMRLKSGETHAHAAIRGGIQLQGQNGNGDGTVWLAEWNGMRGEARFQ